MCTYRPVSRDDLGAGEGRGAGERVVKGAGERMVKGCR